MHEKKFWIEQEETLAYLCAYPFPIKVLAFDLDGTVLTTEKKVTKETLAVFQQAADAGIACIPVTGRPLQGIPEVIRNLPYIPYIITSNGGKIYKMPEAKEIYADYLPKEKAVAVLHAIADMPVVPDCFINGKGNMPTKAFTLVPKMGMSEAVKAYLLSDTRDFHENIEAFVAATEDGIEKITINFILEEDGSKRFGDLVYEKLKQIPDLSLVVGAIHNYEVSNLTATKGNALDWLLKNMKIAPEHAVAFGDEKNDVTMLEKAGIGVAMGNGVPEAKAVAQCIADTNDSDGVAKIIKNILAFRKKI